MSRCFPYILTRSGVPGEALIESIKLQASKETGNMEEKRETKEERKGKKSMAIAPKNINEKRENKEKRKGKKTSKASDAKISMTIAPKSFGGKYSEDTYLGKRKEVEAEAIEKSEVTEEHGQPMDSDMSCYLSDSSRSNKRKRHNPPSTSSNSSPSGCRLSHGNILRIRLPAREPGSRELPLNTLKKVTDDKIANSTKPHKDEKRWAKLMDVLVPQNEGKDHDDEWLLPTKRCRSDNDRVLCNGSVASTLWPSATYLLVADIHALPYTLLF